MNVTILTPDASKCLQMPPNATKSKRRTDFFRLIVNHKCELQFNGSARWKTHISQYNYNGGSDSVKPCTHTHILDNVNRNSDETVHSWAYVAPCLMNAQLYTPPPTMEMSQLVLNWMEFGWICSGSHSVLQIDKNRLNCPDRYGVGGGAGWH